MPDRRRAEFHKFRDEAGQVQAALSYDHDGFEMSHGAVPYNFVCKAKDGLINFIHARSSLIRIKHVLP